MLRSRTAPQFIQNGLGRLGLSGGGWDGLFSLADQAVVSGVTFLVTVLLGRWCGANELGAYALGFTIVVFVVAAQMAIISIPYTNHWRRLPEDEQKDFAGCALIQQIFFAGLAAGAVTAIAVTLWLCGYRERINGVLLVLGAVLPLYLVREFTRRHAFAHLRMRAAIALDGCTAVLQIGGLVALFLTDKLTAVSAFAAIGGGAGLAGGLALFLSRRSFSFRLSMLRRAMRQHWTFGRWVLASTAVGVIQGYLIYWLLALMGGTTETGILAACMTIVLIVSPLKQGMGNFLEPKAAKTFAKGGHTALRKMVWRVSLMFGGAMLVYCCTAAVLGGWFVSILYAGNEYAGHGHLVFVLSLYAAAGVIDLGASHGLRAMYRPAMGFWACVFSFLVTLTSGLFLVPKYGIMGGAYALLMGELCCMSIRVAAFVQLSAPDRGSASAHSLNKFREFQAANE